MSDEDLDLLGDLCELHAVLFALRRLGSTAGDEAIFETMESVGRCQQQIRQREETSPDLALHALRTRFSLTETELQALALLSVLAIHPTLRVTFQQLTGGSSTEPTLDAIKSVVYGDGPSRLALRELSPNGTLRRHGLVERTDSGGSDAHDARKTWAISPRVLAFLHGERDVQPLPGTRVRSHVEAPSDLQLTPDAVERVRTALRTNSAVLVSGLPGLGRRTLCWSVARELGIDLLEIDLGKLSRSAERFGAELHAIARELRLTKRVPLVANLDAIDKSDERWSLLATIFAAFDGPVIVTATAQPPTLGWERTVVRVDLQQPTGKQRATLWRKKLGHGTDEDATVLAGLAPLAPALIDRAARTAVAAAGDAALTAEHVLDGIRTVTSNELVKYATRIRVTQSWEDIVLADEHADAVEALLQRVRGRRTVYEDWGFGAKVGKGLGISALFSGPPGTGKTMVAGLIAKELSSDLYQVDVAKIVSKYIGETEKNLAGLFDAADATSAVLLFDEADALFGKRTDVKSSNDRNANLETNFLLQRLETFQGVCLLTTNHESSMDAAFQRRLSLHLRFKLPEAWEREHLWRAVLPAGAPVESIDFGALARKYEMSGGYIKNAALRAAFAAASDNGAITMQHLEKAARMEYEAMGKLALA